MYTIKTTTPQETWALADQLIQNQTINAGTIIALHGDLGAGKTSFVQGLARALKINEPITSPTYTLVSTYPGQIPLFHLDLYRLSDPQEVLGLGLEEYFQPNAIVAIEWAERAEGLLPDHLLHIKIKVDQQTQKRTFVIYKED